MGLSNWHNRFLLHRTVGLLYKGKVSYYKSSTDWSDEKYNEKLVRPTPMCIAMIHTYIPF